MMLNVYREIVLGACRKGENFYIARDNTDGYYRNIVLNLKNDITFSIEVNIDYRSDVLISDKVLDYSYLLTATPVDITFRYNGQYVYSEKGYFGVFDTELFGVFIPSDFTSIRSIEYDRYCFYKTLNDILLDCKVEYENIFDTEDKEVIREEWNWSND